MGDKIRRNSSASMGSESESTSDSDEFDEDTNAFNSPHLPRHGGGRNQSMADMVMMPTLEKRVASLMNVPEQLREKKRNDYHNKQQQLLEEKDREQKRAWRWTKALEELVATEKKYIADLETTKSVFVKPLQQSVGRSGATGKPLLDAKLVQTIFSDIDIFYKLHVEQFLPGLEKEAKAGGQGVGKFFSDRASFLKMYTSYINKYEESVALLQREEDENPGYKNFLAERYKMAEIGKLKMNDFLIKPLHRLTRYALLLRELEKNCKPELTDVKRDLQTAITKVSAVTSLVNDRVRDAENRRKVVSISEELQNVLPDLIQPARRYVLDCSFQHFSEGGAKDIVNIYIFNDLVVTAMKTKEFFKESYTVKQFQVSTMMMLIDVVPPNGQLYTVRLYDHQLQHIDLCTTSFDNHMDLVRTLVELNVLVEGAPYPKNRPLDKRFSSCTMVALGERDSGKLQWIKTVRSHKHDMYFGNDAQGTDKTSEILDPFVTPLVVNSSQIYNVKLVDTFSDCRFNPGHEQLNRKSLAAADVVLLFINIDKDYHTEYWKTELANVKFENKPPLVLVNAHPSKEPQKMDPACIATAKTLKAKHQLPCVTTNKQSVRECLNTVTALVPHDGGTRRLSILGVALPYS